MTTFITSILATLVKMHQSNHYSTILQLKVCEINAFMKKLYLGLGNYCYVTIDTGKKISGQPKKGIVANENGIKCYQILNVVS